MSITLWKPEPNVVLHQALGKAGEEAAELSKELLRCIIQGFEASDPKTGVRNIDNLADEIADMYAALQWLQEVGQIEPDETRMDTKLRGFRRWQKMLEQDMAAPSPEPKMVGSQALQDVAAERRRQVEKEGWSTKHDDRHDSGQLAAAAAAYAEDAAHQLHETRYSKAPDWVDGVRDFGQHPPLMWPWEDTWKPGEPRRELVKAAALIIAEIERLDRAALSATATESE